MYYLNSRAIPSGIRKAASLTGLALLLLITFLFSQKLQAQDAENPFPTILVKDSAGVSSPLRMSELSIDVKVIGNLATTTMEMTFYNDLDRILEGQLYFPLGEGQTVSRFAMDVEGELREGVVVEKKQGRVAFESTVRRKIDPGLLEWTAGNNFKSRIYPIPRKGTKRILIAYEQELKHTDQGAEYQLPLQFKEKLDEFGLRIEVFDQLEVPNLHGNLLEGLNFEQFERTFLAKMERKDYLANKQLAFRLPKPSKYTEIFIEEEDKEGTYFFVHVSPEITEKPKEMPKKICVVWDVSNSGGNRDLEKELALLDSYFAKVGDAEVRLVTFSAAIHNRRIGYLANGKWPALRASIEHLQYDGGTQLGCLDLKEFECDEFLLLSDGISNFGKSKVLVGDKPVYTINSQATANHTQLTQIAEETGGRYLNLNELKPQEALDGLCLLPFRFISATYSSAAINETYPKTSRPIVRDFSLAGKMKTTNATLTLNFGIGTEILEKQVIVLDKRKQATKSGLVRRIWAQKKLGDLERSAEENEEAITKLGKKYSLVTRNTSLIVLDRLEDYVAHEIVPPKSMQAEYFKQVEANWERKTESKKQKIDQVVKLFEERKEWWEKEFKWPDTNHTGEDDKTSERNAEGLEAVTGGVAAEFGEVDGGVIDLVEEVEQLIEEPEMIEEESEVSELQMLEPLRLPVETESAAEIIVTSGGAMQELETVQLEEMELERRLETISLEESTNEAFGDDEFGGAEDVDFLVEEAPSDQVEIVEEFMTQESAPDADWDFGGGDESDDWGDDDWDGAEDEVLNGNRVTNISVVADSSVMSMDHTVNSRDMGGKGMMKLQDWDPDEPYMDKLKAAGSANLYATYLELKPEYANTPSFFLDCADYFRKQGEEETAMRILSNIAELELDNYRLLRVLAHRLQQLDEIDLAVMTFREVLDMREEEPQSHRDLALALADQGETQEAVDLLWQVVETRWDGRFPEIEVIAIEELNNIAAQAKRKPSLAKVDARLRKQLPLNIRVVVNWDADNCDMDLWVTDPRGEKCFYKNRNTAIGGYMSNDFTGGYGPEEFLLRRAMPGAYTVAVNYYSDSQQSLAGATTVQVSMYTDYGTSREKRQDVTLRLKDTKETINIGTFVYGK